MNGELRGSRAAVSALALMLFCFLTSEVFVAGGMGPMSRDLRVSTTTVGSLVTVYAVIAAVSIVPMTAVARRVRTRTVLVVAVLVLVAAHVLMAMTSSLTVVLVTRATVALFHGPVWALSPVIAGRLAPSRPAAATAAVFLGPSLANIAGAPLVAAVSDHASWRVASAAVAALGLVCALVLATRLPTSHGSVDERGRGTGKACTTGANSRSAVLFLCLAVVLLASAHLSVFTYISMGSQAAGIPAENLAALLLAMGLAGAGGTLVAGRGYDAHPTAGLLVACLAMVVGLLLSAGHAALFLAGALIWPAAYAALTAVLPAAVVQAAPAWAERASAWYVLAFQIGIATGAQLGAHPVPVAAPDTARALTAALLALAAVPLLHRRRPPAVRPSTNVSDAPRRPARSRRCRPRNRAS